MSAIQPGYMSADESLKARAAFARLPRPTGRPHCRVCRSTDVTLVVPHKLEWDVHAGVWVDRQVLYEFATQTCASCGTQGMPAQPAYWQDEVAEAVSTPPPPPPPPARAVRTI